MKRSGADARLPVAAAVAILCFIAYLLTLGPGPFWQDSGFFHAGVRAGGGLAPPGYPVYLILARPFVAAYDGLIPGRPAGEALNLFSAIWGALTADLISLSVMLLLTPGYKFMKSALPRPLPKLTSTSLFVGALAGLLAGLSYSIWFQAINAEAYAFNGFFAALLLFLFLLLGAEGPLSRNPTTRQRRYILLLFVVHGLSCGNHPVTITFLPMFLYFFWRNRDILHNRRFVIMILLVYVASGLIPYFYLPWAARAYPQTIYNDVTTVKGFLLHVTGSQWTGKEQSYGWSAERFLVFPKMLFQEMFVAGLLALVIGIIRLWKEQRGWFILLLFFIFPAFLLPLLYLQGGEYDFWLIPLYITFYVIGGVGFAQILKRFGRSVPVMCLAVLLTLGPPIWVNLPYVDRHDQYVPEDFARNLFRHVSNGGVLFAYSDQECALTYYAQVVAKLRPDVTLIFAPLLTSHWYPKYIRQRYPKLQIPESVKPVSEDGTVSEGDWVAAIVQANLDRYAFYISKRPEIAPPPPLAWVPAGGLWKLDAHAPRDITLQDWEYSYRNANPFGRKPERLHAPIRVTDPSTGQTSVLRVTYTSEIRMFHLQARKNLGDWYLDHDDFAKAVEIYRDLFAQDSSITLPALRASYGKALFAIDRMQDALPQFEMALSGSIPIRAEAMLYMGQIYATQGNVERAQQIFATVRQIDPLMWRENESALRNAGFLQDSQTPPK
jgi:tetratricopeptide (TPR) repeat protein